MKTLREDLIRRLAGHGTSEIDYKIAENLADKVVPIVRHHLRNRAQPMMLTAKPENAEYLAEVLIRLEVIDDDHRRAISPAQGDTC